MWLRFFDPLYRWLTDYLGSVGFILYGSKGGSSAPAPDPALIAAQIKSMGIQDSAITKMITNADDLAPLQKEQMQFGLDTSKTAYDQSQADREWMLDRRGSLSGLQDTLVSDANSFNTDARREQLAGQANADVTQAFSSARDQNGRAMARMGVNPSSGRALDMGNQMSIAQAAASAGASNKARSDARTEGYALTDRATNALSGYPAMSSNATASGANFGGMGLSTANSGLAGMNSGYGAGSSAAGSMGANAAGMYGAMGSYKNGQDQINQGESLGSILGGVGGLALGISKFSDRRLKDNIVLVGKDEATGLNLYEFNYKSQPSLRFRGVMADEVEAFMPSAVVRNEDGFMAVDYSQIGIDMVEV